MRARGYSKPLQRRITDFGADVTFGKISFKLKEHYGIEVPKTSAQAITEEHACKVRENECLQTEIPDRSGVDQIVAEMDGSMIPIVSTDNIPSGDMPIDRVFIFMNKDGWFKRWQGIWERTDPKS